LVILLSFHSLVAFVSLLGRFWREVDAWFIDVVVRKDKLLSNVHPRADHKKDPKCQYYSLYQGKFLLNLININH
jgi:hypothetical protein